jgi:hypothetical protein
MQCSRKLFEVTRIVDRVSFRCLTDWFQLYIYYSWAGVSFADKLVGFRHVEATGRYRFPGNGKHWTR